MTTMQIPTNERETIFTFNEYRDALGWNLAYSAEPFPDAIISNGHETLLAEFEYRSSNFKAHGHDPNGCDLVVCWVNDWPKAPLPVWAIGETLQAMGLFSSVEEPVICAKSGPYGLHTERDAKAIAWLSQSADKDKMVRKALRFTMDAPQVLRALCNLVDALKKDNRLLCRRYLDLKETLDRQAAQSILDGLGL